jgi:hypothetical protein
MYQLKVYGTEIEISSHHIKDEMFEKVNKMMIIEGYRSPNDCQFRIEELIGWDKLKPNMFIINKPLLENLKFELYEYGQLIKEFTIKDINIVDKRDESKYYSVPHFEWYHNIIVSTELNKGPLVSLEFQGDADINITDISCSVSTFEDFERFYDFVDSFYYKGQILQISEIYEKKLISNKIKIWTLDDIVKDSTTN